MKKIDKVFIILGIVFFVLPATYYLGLSLYHDIIRTDYDIISMIHQNHEDEKIVKIATFNLFLIWLTYCLIRLYKTQKIN